MAYARLQFAHFFSLEAHLIRFTFRMGPVWFVGPCSYLFPVDGSITSFNQHYSGFGSSRRSAISAALVSFTTRQPSCAYFPVSEVGFDSWLTIVDLIL